MVKFVLDKMRECQLRCRRDAAVAYESYKRCFTISYVSTGLYFGSYLALDMIDREIDELLDSNMDFAKYLIFARYCRTYSFLFAKFSGKAVSDNDFLSKCYQGMADEFEKAARELGL